MRRLTRALVTGCAGFIGSHLTESLLADGVEVVGVDCFNPNYDRDVKVANLDRARDSGGFAFHEMNLCDADVDALVAECDTVFHLAGEPGVRSSWGASFETYLANNLLATQRLLEALQNRPETRMVYASSSSIYGQAECLPTPESTIPRPFSPYGVTKLGAEQLCLLYHGNHAVDTVGLRYFSVYGPRQRPDMAFNRFCRAALTGAPITVFGDGTQTRDFTYVADVISATRAAASVAGIAGRVYNIGGGSRTSVNEALAIIGEVAGRSLAVEYLAHELGDVRDTGADSTAARLALSFDPTTTVHDGLAAEFQWAAEHVAWQPVR